MSLQDVSEDKADASVSAVEEMPVKAKKGRWANHIKKSDLAKLALSHSPIVASTPTAQTHTPAQPDATRMYVCCYVHVRLLCDFFWISFTESSLFSSVLVIHCLFYILTQYHLRRQSRRNGSGQRVG